MTRDAYLTPYRDSAATHGAAFEVTLWASPESQARRFQVFAQMLPLAGKRILDAGCSRGDLAQWLTEHGIVYGSYVGVDALEEVITYARGRGLPRCQFHAGDFLSEPALLALEQPQVICISGSLNTMSDAQVNTVLENAWAATESALMFNFLSDRTGPAAVPQGYPARRLGTMKLLDWAMKKTWAVSFRQDYFRHGHDATILMRKAQALFTGPEFAPAIAPSNIPLA